MGGAIQVRCIDPHDRRSVQSFNAFPHRLYRDYLLWAPPFRSEEKLIFDRRRHPFYQHSLADFFLVEKNNQAVGRFALLHHRPYCQVHNQNTAFFHLLEFEQDPEITAAFVDTARSWCREHGLNRLAGPRGFLRSSGYGTLVDGFDQVPAVGIPYNPPYYDELLTGAGFAKETDLLSGFVTPSYHLPEKLVAAAEKIRQENGFEIAAFKRKYELRPWIEQINTVLDQAFAGNPTYMPMTAAEFKLAADNIFQIANPRLIKIILKEGQIAGFLLAYPNISKSIRKIDGKIWPTGWLYLLHEIRTTHRIDLNGLGLLPQYQGRGANIFLYVALERTLRDYGAEYGEIVQVDERNIKSKADMDRLGVTWHKRHRVYHLEIEP